MFRREELGYVTLNGLDVTEIVEVILEERKEAGIPELSRTQDKEQKEVGAPQAHVSERQ